MTFEPRALLLPLAFWLPLAAAVFAIQVLAVAVCLRPPRRELILSAGALLVADAVLLLLVRACVTAMGRMDYSETFSQWRWYFLALVALLAGLPIPLWVLSLRLVQRRPARSEHHSPLIHPLFRAALASWLGAAAIILLFGGNLTFVPHPGPHHPGAGQPT